MLDLRYCDIISRSAEYLQLSLKLVEDIFGTYNVQVNAVTEKSGLQCLNWAHRIS